MAQPIHASWHHELSLRGWQGEILWAVWLSRAANTDSSSECTLSPADLYQIENPDGLYGNLSPKTTRGDPAPVEGARPFKSDVTFEFDEIDDYNEYFLNQLYELLTDYGPIDEVWFDGAHPKRKGARPTTTRHGAN